MTFDEIRAKLKTKTVGIAGAGGLGSNCAVALARSGVGKLIVADFDVIDLSNLNRQYYFYHQLGRKKVLALQENVKMVNPEVVFVPLSLKLDSVSIKKVFANCDIIVEAFDRNDMKQMIIETVQEFFPDKPLVIGSGMAGFGGNNLIRTEQHGILYICGDQQSEVSDVLPPLAPRVGVVSMMQANQVLEILLKS
ncbi:MAG: sulfur carrier protein ThiS adenylyltransferase ThiF [Bacteroidales bacterium]|nr:sulfur carrier protein ThiS adenylyltransferase ThiF [Bacteroidales bacterium]MCF8454516.1 sulfur carrier protein ThiS adenylyltransferase ThiF [Bacteroidales bacterium]